MSDIRDATNRREPIRIVDRRGFTSDGEPRTPDTPVEDAATRTPQAPTGRATARDASEGPSGASSQEGQVASSHFRSLVLNLATSAAASLGEIPNPYSQQTEIDLDGARQAIDLLHALRSKTRGNLTSEESSLLDSLLYDLQMKFVSVEKSTTEKS